jgi:hypothetical protein
MKTKRQKQEAGSIRSQTLLGLTISPEQWQRLTMHAPAHSASLVARKQLLSQKLCSLTSKWGHVTDL